MPFDGLPVEPVRTLIAFDRRFVDIRDCTELPELRRGADLTGVIELTIGPVTLLGPNWESDIPGLWGAVADLVAGYRENGRAEVRFPDQSAYLTLEPVPPGLVRITVLAEPYRETAVTGEEKLLSALEAGAEEFFAKLEELTGRSVVGRRGPSAG
ncbi:MULTISPECIES: hypothetical protein [Amycolatopsis]|uniref:Uncharacterized protein n=1 Tax=Amycolatopsis bullii TaxID=941987 RepID=A0ABQ3KHR7_9PSEU|nr:hypothetical protein [Amycolatopsis bullii]GHG20074.1 hypothetical protein GCM10017567_43460 [Amycolatopsis bullii]